MGTPERRHAQSGTPVSVAGLVPGMSIPAVDMVTAVDAALRIAGMRR
ncbi:hypothetical protein MPTA5024_27555 [Microbispora sp. ATCC PTA-5024]|nr:hypothetical protein MPTA5024_27555 [Microbispora sp. ATCC PTA-5024]